MQPVIRKLRSERIDVVRWSDDIVVYVENALAPAKIRRVSVTSDGGAHRPHLDVIAGGLAKFHVISGAGFVRAPTRVTCSAASLLATLEHPAARAVPRFGDGR